MDVFNADKFVIRRIPTNLEKDISYKAKEYLTISVNMKSKEVPFFLFWPNENVCIYSIGHLRLERPKLSFVSLGISRRIFQGFKELVPLKLCNNFDSQAFSTLELNRKHFISHLSMN